jgi:hypothetical protein
VNISVTNLPPAVSILVASNSTWRYLDDGTDQGTTWTNLAFSDASWGSGPAELGFGDGPPASENRPEATVILRTNATTTNVTFYFRQKFQVVNAASFTGLTVRVLRDDGAVVFLNGNEVFHDANLPPNPINYQTFALAAIGGAEEHTFLNASVNPALLVDGTNVLAVEVHQQSFTSSDVSFMLELQGLKPPASNAPPTATITTPANLASFIAPTTIVIEATASDPDGSVATVEFFANGALLGSDATGPFSYSWSGASPGSFALRAVAVDDNGRRGTSAPVNITVTGAANLPPTATWGGPADGSTFTAPGTFTLTAAWRGWNSTAAL